jgi:hypothetical protein
MARGLLTTKPAMARENKVSDLTKYNGQKFIETPGTYEAQITKCVTDYSADKGCDTFEYTFTTEVGIVTKKYFDSEKAGYFLRVLAEACELSDAELANFEGTMLDGKNCIICVTMRKYDGKDFAQIDGVRKSTQPFDATGW